jgi:transposase-like protein
VSFKERGGLKLDYAEMDYRVSALARRFKVDRSNLDKTIRGKRRPSPALLTRMGATVKLSYEIRVVRNDSK